MKVNVVRSLDPIKSVTLKLSKDEAYELKALFENYCFGHNNTLGPMFDQRIYYPLKRALKGVCTDKGEFNDSSSL